MGRLTNATYADPSTTSYSYDTIGRLSTITDSISGTISSTYTDTGCSSGCTAIPDRVAQVNTPNGNISYQYDILGRRTSMTVEGQPTVSYEYDDAGRLTNINTLINTQPAAFDIGYDGLGRRSTVTFPNGVISSYGYDNVSDLMALHHTAPGNTILESLAYTYNAIGNRTTMDRPSVTLPLPQAKSGITHNDLNQTLTVNDKAITYDLNGNMTTVTNSCGTTTYTWDARNQLAGISGYNTDCSTLTASFQYDALGRRTSKTVNGGTSQYLYDGIDIVQELENGTVTANYIRTLGIDEPLARIKADGTVRYYQTDAQGSVIALTDETGAVTTQYAYDPFGGVVITGEASDNPFQYTGRENDCREKVPKPLSVCNHQCPLCNLLPDAGI